MGSRERERDREREMWRQSMTAAGYCHIDCGTASAPSCILQRILMRLSCGLHSNAIWGLDKTVAIPTQLKRAAKCNEMCQLFDENSQRGIARCEEKERDCCSNQLQNGYAIKNVKSLRFCWWFSKSCNQMMQSKRCKWILKSWMWEKMTQRAGIK